MSKRKLEAKEWLKEVGFSDAEVDEMAGRLSAEKMEKIAEGYMRQSDYDSTMNTGKADIEKAKEDLALANQRLTAEMAEWGQLTNAEKANSQRLRADLDVAQADALRTRQVLERLGAEHGIDVSKALEGAPVTKPATATAPALDPNQYISRDDYLAAQQQLANVMLTYPVEMMALAQEHQTLFGAPLDPREIAQEIQSRASNKGNQKSLNPRDIWEERHKVNDKREAVRVEKYNADIAAAEARGREAALSESVIPGQVTTAGRHSIVFQGERKSAIQRPQPMDTVSRAAAALRTHKYNPEINPAGAGKTT